MQVISRVRLREFAEKHSQSESALAGWYRIVSKTTFTSIAQLRQTFPHADPVGKYVVLSVGGNDYRLITAIHFNRHKVYIRAVLTHAQYTKLDLRKGTL